MSETRARRRTGRRASRRKKAEGSDSPEAAAARAAAFVERRPQSFRGRLRLGRALRRVGAFEEAQAAFRAAASLAPGEHAPWRELADGEALAGRLEAERRVLAEALSQVDDPAPLRLRLAHVRLNAGDAAGAAAALAELDPAALPDDRRLRLAEAWAQCGRDDEAAATMALVDPDGPCGGDRLLDAVLRGAERPLAAAERRRRALGDAAGEDAHTALLAELACRLGPRRDRVPARLGRIAARLRGASDRPGLARLAAFEAEFEGAEGYRPAAATAAALATLLCPIHRPEDAANLARQLLRQDHPRLEVVVAVDSPAVDAGALGRALGGGRFERIEILRAPAPGGVARALAAGLAAARGEFVLRFDADDVYLDGYVSRTLGFMRRHRAEICARTHFLAHLEALEALTLNATVGAEAWTARPAGVWQGTGATLAFRREAGVGLGFDAGLRQGEDVDFLHRALGRGLPVVAAPPLDHVVRRRAEAGLHTWRTSDVALFGQARRLLAFGPLSRLERAMARR